MSPQQSSPQQQQQRQEPQQKKRRSLLVKIKDFAFVSTDDRHAGLGADVPKPNRVRVLNRFHRSRTASNGSHLSVSSIGTEEDGDGENEDEEGGLGEDGWGGFKWGFGRFSSWGFGRGGTSGRGDNSGEGSSASSASFPSKTDFARNFGEEAEEPDTYAYEDDEDEDDDEREYYDLGCGGSPHAPAEEEPLYPGLYRALYAFEPEGTAEMKLEEDQVVKVIGRGGGVGWAVVDRGGGGGHALVPESYLEVVRLDEDVGA
jgi:SH3 domain